jgi:hypothetical protein
MNIRDHLDILFVTINFSEQIYYFLHMRNYISYSTFLMANVIVDRYADHHDRYAGHHDRYAGHHD